MSAVEGWVCIGGVDVRDADGGPAGRVGYVSAMTMLQSTDGEQGSYLEIAEAIEMRSSHATADLRQLWRRIVFSILISNTDDHLRNHGSSTRTGTPGGCLRPSTSTELRTRTQAPERGHRPR